MKLDAYKKWLPRWDIGTRLTGAVASILLVALGLSWLLSRYSLQATAHRLGHADLQQQAQTVLLLCQELAATTHEKINGPWRRAASLLQDKAAWQFTPAQWQQTVDDLAVDDVVCAFYQKTSGQHLVCVTTSEKREDGKRLSGHILFPQRKDGSVHEAVVQALQGKAGAEIPTLHNRFRYTVYLPVCQDKDTVGVLVLAVPVPSRTLDAVMSFNRDERTVVVMDKSGLAWVHPDSRGKNILKWEDADGNALGQTIWQRSSELQSGGMATLHYRVAPTAGVLYPREQVAMVAFSAPWQWAVCVAMPADRLSAGGGLKWLLLLVWLAATGGSVVVGIRVARSLVAPLQRLTACLQDRSQWGAWKHVEEQSEFRELSQAVAQLLACWHASMVTIQQRAASLQATVQELTAHAGKLGENSAVCQDSWQQLDAGAGQLLPLVNSAESSLASGGDEYKGFVTALKGVEDAAQKIAQTVQEQTNLAHKALDAVDGMQDFSVIAENAQAQAAAAVETTTSTQEMTVSIRNVAQNAQQAMLQAKGALKAAEEGSRSVNEAVQGMKGIADSSERMSEIIGVVSDIAEQTNLLALNAAIEAARAGIYGKGFAVVAAEVQNLAERSANAANEISFLIRENGRHAELGNKLISKASQSLEQILLATRETNSMVTSISQATIEQEAISSEVLRAMENLTQLTTNITERTRGMSVRREQIAGSIKALQQMSAELASGSERQRVAMPELSRLLTAASSRHQQLGQQCKQQQERTVVLLRLLQSVQQPVTAHGALLQQTVASLEQLSRQLQELSTGLKV